MCSTEENDEDGSVEEKISKLDVKNRILYRKQRKLKISVNNSKKDINRIKEEIIKIKEEREKDSDELKDLNKKVEEMKKEREDLKVELKKLERRILENKVFYTSHASKSQSSDTLVLNFYNYFKNNQFST